MPTEPITGFSRPLIQVPLGQMRAQAVDETAVTLRLPPVPRPGLFRHVPRDVAGIIGSALLMACLTLAIAPPPRVAASEPFAERAPLVQAEVSGEPPRSDRGPVLAAVSVPPRLQPPQPQDEIIIFEEDDVADDEILIYEEPPKPALKAAPAPKHSRSAANVSVRLGREARAAGNRRIAKKHYKSALDAWPTYAVAASALAELHMQDRQYRRALPYARRAAHNAPTKAEYQLLYGDALFLAKRRDAAKRAWKKAAALGSKKARKRLGHRAP